MKIMQQDPHKEVAQRISYALKAAIILHNVDPSFIQTITIGDLTFYQYGKKVLIVVEWNGINTKIWE